MLFHSAAVKASAVLKATKDSELSSGGEDDSSGDNEDEDGDSGSKGNGDRKEWSDDDEEEEEEDEEEEDDDDEDEDGNHDDLSDGSEDGPKHKRVRGSNRKGMDGSSSAAGAAAAAAGGTNGKVGLFYGCGCVPWMMSYSHVISYHQMIFFFFLITRASTSRSRSIAARVLSAGTS